MTKPISVPFTSPMISEDEIDSKEVFQIFQHHDSFIMRLFIEEWLYITTVFTKEDAEWWARLIAEDGHKVKIVHGIVSHWNQRIASKIIREEAK